MGLGDFFKNIFGKKVCDFCGNEVGMMKRSKLKDGCFICSDCDDMCSAHIRKSRYTKDELAGHMEYMKRQDRLFKEFVSDMKSELYPSAYSDMAIQFFDDAGMFRICDRNRDSSIRNYPIELFRYDTVASYEAYVDESEPDESEKSKGKVFNECGIKIRFFGDEDTDAMGELQNGLLVHPYIVDEVKIVFADSERNKENGMRYLDNAIHHFDFIFGVHDDEKGLFSFGMTKNERRHLKAAVSFTKIAGEAVKAAKNGEISEEKQAEITEHMNNMEDAQTGGLSVYTRRADALEAKLG